MDERTKQVLVGIIVAVIFIASVAPAVRYFSDR